jgi:hypothetical protein
MKVCWSMTYVMLTCAESQCQVDYNCVNHVLLNSLNILQAVDKFVCELRLRETNPKKQHKIAALALDSNILQVWPCVLHFKH